MKRKVLATVLCAAIIAIAMGFVVVAKTADASLRTGGSLKTLGEIASPTITNENGSENEQSEAAAEESTEAVTGETADEAAGETASEAAGETADEAASEAADAIDPVNPETVPATEPVENATPSEPFYVSNEHELRHDLQQSGKIILNGDIQVTDTLRSDSRTEPTIVTIDGAGNSIICSGDIDNLWGVFQIKNNVELTLQNVTIDTTGMDHDNRLADDRYEDYYAIYVMQGGKLIIGKGTNIICNDRPEDLINQRKGGIWLDGTAVMTGGKISGFYQGGVSVGEKAEFTLVGGTIEQISVKVTDPDAGGGAINNLGTTIIKGGSLSGNVVGVFNNANLKMTKGEITNNQDCGIINNDKDGVTGKPYKSVAELSGGTIKDNGVYALENRKRGKFTIDGAHISGEVLSAMHIFSNSRRSTPKAVVMNSDNSILNLISGEIVSNAANEVAIYNDGTSKLTVKGGTISANGAGSVAIQNDNTSAGAMDLSGGSVNGTVINTPTPSGSGGSGSSGGSGGSGGSGRIITGNSATKPSIPETPGAWVQDQTGWKFTAPNQTPYVNTWIRSKNQWYWVGADGYMKTGWNQIAQKWFYLTPVTGEMKTGWLQDGAFWYYLDETGAMKTGWLQDGAKWYYLNQDGKMAVNTTTPDGYKVDGSGAWVK